MTTIDHLNECMYESVRSFTGLESYLITWCCLEFAFCWSKKQTKTKTCLPLNSAFIPFTPDCWRHHYHSFFKKSHLQNNCRVWFYRIHCFVLLIFSRPHSDSARAVPPQQCYGSLLPGPLLWKATGKTNTTSALISRKGGYLTYTDSALETRNRKM